MLKELTRPLRGNVLKRHGKRRGRGFSKQEIELAGLKIEDTKKFKIIIDKKRKTIHEENVKVLKYLKGEMK